MQLARSVLALTAIAALGACADQTVPLAPHPRPSLAVASARGTGASRMVVFGGTGVPASFAAKVAALGGSLDATYDAVGVAVVSGISDENVSALARVKGVQSVSDAATFTLDEKLSTANTEAVATALDAHADSPTAPATAFFFPRQWSYRAISAPAAWAAGDLGSPSVHVAILDTGIDYTYIDLQGLVDLAHSASFVPTDAPLVDAFFPGRNHVTDLDGHGTHVASTVSSHALAVAGVTARTTLMAVKVLGATGSGSYTGVFQGIMYATDNGADVINMSLGSNFLKHDNPGAVSAFNRALNYAHSHGVTVVVAAGNDAIDLDHDGNLYAAMCDDPKVICVAATGPTSSTTVNGPFFPSLDAPATYGNFGRSAVNVAAPGGNIAPDGSTAVFVWQACSTTWLVYDETTDTFSKSVCAADLAHVYTLGAIGTSMAAPHVSGLAALLVERYGRNPGQIRAAIQQSADDLGQSGTDPFYGKGRINVARAMGVLN